MIAYKLSRFTIALPVALGPTNTVVYHTLTRALIQIPTAQWERVWTNPSGEDPEITATLLAQGILVPLDVNETVLYEQWRDRHVHDFRCMRSKTLVTRQCNNRCTYCIVNAEAAEMSDRTAKTVDDFYLGQISRRRPSRVRDDYLGGEPLLNTGVVAQSAERRFYFCKGKGIDYGFTITTNGTLITNQIVERLKRVGLTAVRVSIAGPEEVHDALRPSATGAGTYASIMKNLERINRLVDVLIECQYDAGEADYRRIPEMMIDLLDRKIPVAEINFTPILPKRGSEHFCTGVGAADAYLFLVRQAEEYGLPVNLAPPTNACMADFRSIFVFDTDGALIPCPSLQSGEMAYGTAVHGIDFVAEAGVLARRLPERCRERCELLPLCMGGCRLQALTRDGDFGGFDCHYEIYRTLVEHYAQGQAAPAGGEKKAV